MSRQNQKMHFKGKQVLLLGLVALVITAGYYRWNIEKEQLSSAVTVANEISEEAVPDGESGKKDDGKSEKTEKSNDEITRLKQERDTARSQSVEEWTKMTKSSEATEENKREAGKKISAEAENADKERKIETQVKAKGYEDCIAYVDESGVAVTVCGGEINGERVAQIKDIIVSVTNVSVKNIKINAI